MLIGILQTGHAPDALRPDVGDYDNMFEQLLDGHGFSFRTWSVVDLDFPNAIDAADGWLITGSRHGVYEDHPWIPPLEQMIRGIYAAGIPLVGICFGHQIIAQALGGRVEKFAKGWAVGPMQYRWEDGGTTVLNAWHQDQVTEPPTGATTVASNPFCEHAALIYGKRALTVQPHPEFDRGFMSGLITHRGGAIPPERLAIAKAGLDTPVDNATLANQIAAFFHLERPQA